MHVEDNPPDPTSNPTAPLLMDVEDNPPDPTSNPTAPLLMDVEDNPPDPTSNPTAPLLMDVEDNPPDPTSNPPDPTPNPTAPLLMDVEDNPPDPTSNPTAPLLMDGLAALVAALLNVFITSTKASHLTRSLTRIVTPGVKYQIRAGFWRSGESEEREEREGAGPAEGKTAV
ncbi:unnamed protein product [Arctogadus glacialis]